MVIKNVNLETVCGITSKLPDHTLPEIAFAGKSNVGKSSLINALMNRKALARTSAKPGKTQTINFYNINEEMYLVDLPGYGYAKVSEQEKAQWGKLIERYLHGSKQLRAVFLLIDIRHDPSANDKMMYDWIVDQGFNPELHRNGRWYIWSRSRGESSLSHHGLSTYPQTMCAYCSQSPESKKI